MHSGRLWRLWKYLGVGFFKECSCKGRKSQSKIQENIPRHTQELGYVQWATWIFLFFIADPRAIITDRIAFKLPLCVRTGLLCEHGESLEIQSPFEHTERKMQFFGARQYLLLNQKVQSKIGTINHCDYVMNVPLVQANSPEVLVFLVRDANWLIYQRLGKGDAPSLQWRERGKGVWVEKN